MVKDKDQFRAPSPESLAAGYETSGVSINGLAIFLICMILFAATVHVAIWYGMRLFDITVAAQNRSPSALQDPRLMGGKENLTRLPMPPPPRIQPSAPQTGMPDQPLYTPRAELQLMYRAEDGVFKQMGWKVDEPSHVQTQIPADAIAAVIRDESQRQKHPAFTGPKPGNGREPMEPGREGQK